ncbi:hypothetical protein ElyMa_004645800 [Elysia marginata]|uniref:Uncharacterized protein n=1 Tax=Elysia marginata TaxID=1093978 RepID=A0AAV4I1Z7_9GAST|nr:hypothetical protein ElyMa_004645800 [Elysia marginata]
MLPLILNLEIAWCPAELLEIRTTLAMSLASQIPDQVGAAYQVRKACGNEHSTDNYCDDETKGKPDTAFC